MPALVVVVLQVRPLEQRPLISDTLSPQDLTTDPAPKFIVPLNMRCHCLQSPVELTPRQPRRHNNFCFIRLRLIIEFAERASCHFIRIASSSRGTPLRSTVRGLTSILI